VTKITKTIYKVEGGAASGSSPEPLHPESLAPAQATVQGSVSASSGFSRRRLFWVLVGVAALTVAMIVAIAVLGAAESPAAGTSLSTSTTSSLAAVVSATEPVGTSTATTSCEVTTTGR